MGTPVLPTLQDSQLTLEQAVATLSFQRDDVRNALTGTALVDDLLQVIDWCNRNTEIKVLILTGSGQSFSAGGNIHDMQARRGDFAGDAAELEQRYRSGIQRMPLAMASLDIPCIAAINGAAIGAGFDLSCMCDLRLAAEKCKLGETFVSLGIIPGDGGAWFLQRLVGYQRAFELTLTGRVFDAREALEMGLLLDVCPADELLPRARELADRIAVHPGRASRFAKRLLQKGSRLGLRDFLDQSAAFQGLCHEDPEHLEAIRRLLDRLGNPPR